MTCEVAVMNKRGIALAADSAVTLGSGRKIYHTAEKLFPLSFDIPVAIMTFGAADIMNVPWETVVKIYAQKLGARRFDTLEQYARDFLTFIEGSTVLFPSEDQQHDVETSVRAIWSGLYRDRVLEQFEGKTTITDDERNNVLANIIRRDHEIWDEKYTDLEGLGTEYGNRVARSYEDVIQRVENQVFVDFRLSPPLKSDLRKTVAFMYGKEWFHPADESGVVIAGMGESEAFPAVLQYRVGTIAAGKLRYAKADEARVGPTDAVVMPFAQRETIDMIISGIHPRLREKLIDEVGLSPSGRPRSPQANEKRRRAFAEQLHKEILESYDQPFMGAVSALPRRDLAKMAEALVNLTAFLMRMSADKDETVAEPIDVALLSKGEGFTWIKHKDLF